MDRCALFVDAGYLLADGAMAVHGTRHREAVSWDYAGLLQLLGNLARERTSLPLLRCYWYEATVEGRRTPEHEALADLPGLKLRLGRIRPGRREGIDTQVYRDLMTLARNHAVCDAVLVSGDEDMAQVVSDVQDLGVRVTVVHVAVDGNWTISRTLRQECDDLIEIDAGHLRAYVNLLTGVDNSTGHFGEPPGPLSNGHGQSGGNHAARQPLQTGSRSGPPALYTGHHHAVPLSAPTPTPSQDRMGDPLHSGPLHADPSPPSGSVNSGNPMPQGGHSYVPPQQHNPYGGPQGSSPPPAPPQATTLSEAVQAAHQEGHDFGESVARDAPALWLEAVLARKPRMPSDLEARLLQGSSLPIDFLLHDEVRHALRRGFWDALERSRR